jgi:hypothetical protein
MDDKRIDELFKQAAPPADPELIARVTASVAKAPFAPVRPIANAFLLTAGMFAIASLYAVGAAIWLGVYGFEEMTASTVALMFSLLAIVVAALAMQTVSEMIPGRKMRIASWQLLAIAIAAFVAMDAILFRDYSLDDFVPDGIVCLKAGLEVAAPVGLGIWLLLRRGFAVNPGAAGLAAGTLAGLSGVVMLELHCPYLIAPHVMVWHTAVIPVAALLGMGIASLRRRQRAA